MFPDITKDDIFRIETARLWLRWLRGPDAPALQAFSQLADVAQMTSAIPHPYPAGAAEQFVFFSRGANSAGQSLILAVTLKNKTQTLIGVVSAQPDDDSPGDVEVGYVIAPSHAGRGYATEAVSALVDTVFNLSEVRTLTANVRTINPASRRVLEKCGFAFDGTGLKNLPARGGRHPCDLFSLGRNVWAQRQTARRLARLPGMAHQPGAAVHHPLDHQSQQQ